MKNKLLDYISKYMRLSEQEKKAIIELGILRNYKKKEILLNEGEHSSESYLIIKGCIRCYRVVGAEEKITAFYTEGEEYLPQCSTDNMYAAHYVACVEDSVIVVFNNDMKENLFSKFPRFKILHNMFSEERSARQQTSKDDFRMSSPYQRYLMLLKTRADLVQRVPQYQIASYLDIKLQSLSRIRKRFAKC